MSRNEQFTVTAIAYGGEAVGRLATGEVCFVRGALPGEEVTVEITEERKRFTRGKLLEIRSSSPHRIPPACSCAGQCPGCSFQHCTYELELEWKQKQFERFLKDFPGERLPIFPSPRRTGWRNRLKLACEKGKAGYRGFDNTTLLPIEKCLLAEDWINEVYSRTPVPDEGTLFFRATPSWCGETGTFTEKYLSEEIPSFGSFLVPPTGFFQTNPEVASELCARVVRVLEEFKIRSMLELFCGTGVFSLAAASKLEELESFGIELSAESIETARLNAEKRHLSDRCRFQSGDAAKFQEKKYDLLLVDPPRSGMEEKLVRKILKSRIPLIIYISCGPDTLSRDLKRLSEKYDLLSSGALDMFPCTAHFETFTILTLRK